jgi:hypothetical protein
LCHAVQFFKKFTLYEEEHFIARIKDPPIDVFYSLPPPLSLQQNLLVQVKFIRAPYSNRSNVFCSAVCGGNRLGQEHDTIAQLDRSILLILIHDRRTLYRKKYKQQNFRNFLCKKVFEINRKSDKNYICRRKITSHLTAMLSI